MKSLVVYYSLTGNSRKVADTVARELGADLAEIRCRRYTPGTGWGYLRAAFDSWRGRVPAIEAPPQSPSGYDLVVVGGPIWVSHLAPPVRAWLAQQQARLPAAAFFVTQGGAFAERVFAEMSGFAGKEPRATLAVREEDIKKGRFAAVAASFAAKLRERQMA